MLNGKTAKGMEQITVKFPLTYSILLVPATRDLRFRFVTRLNSLHKHQQFRVMDESDLRRNENYLQ